MKAGAIADTVLGAVAAVILFAMMALTFVDVIFRDVIDAPIRGSFEITELMLVVLIFAGLPLVSRSNEHVTIDMLDHVLPERGRAFLRRMGDLVCALVLSGMTWLIVARAQRVRSYGDTTAQLQIEYWPFVYFMAMLVAVTALIHFYSFFRPRQGGGGGAGTA